MKFLTHRACARSFRTLAPALLCAVGAVSFAWAEAYDASPLGLEDAADLAIATQPLLDGIAAQTRAARESSIAVRQLPDPQLVAGIQDVPVNTRDAYSLTRDSDTQLMIGVMQEFPRAEKRRLRSELIEREVQRLDAEHHLAQRTIRRDASLAWLELWRYNEALRLAHAGLREAQTQVQAVEIALRTGSASQAEFLAARLEVGRLHDTVKGAEQGVAHAQNALARWIDEQAFRPVTPQPLRTSALPTLERVLARVQNHPHVAGINARLTAAQTGADLAHAEYKPDWRIELGYANRPAFSDMVTLQVGIDLPVFARNRQDRKLEAAWAQKEAIASTLEDATRQLAAEARLNYHDFERLTVRLKDYDHNLLPQSASRIEAALAGWRAGRGMLRDVLDARSKALELQMARLELQHDWAKHYVQLRYLGAFETASGTVEQVHE